MLDAVACNGPQEAECFAKAASLDTHKALVHIFFAQRSTKKVRPTFCFSRHGQQQISLRG